MVRIIKGLEGSVMVCRSPHVSPVAFCPIDLFNIMFNTCFYKAREARSSFGTSHVMVRGE